jgi:hypothetical protein
MKRREFIALIGGVTAWPTGARAQQSAMLVIGYFSNRSREAEAYLLQFFRKELADGRDWRRIWFAAGSPCWLPPIRSRRHV